MEKFEKYHPIMTPHYTFNWLTSARLNKSTELMQHYYQDATLTTTKAASLINQTMLKVMRDQQLTWGVFDRASDELVGLANLFEINQQQAALSIELELTAMQPERGVRELLARLVSFAFAELDMKTLYFKQTTTKIDPAILDQLGFTANPATNDWLLNRAVSIERV